MAERAPVLGGAAVSSVETVPVPHGATFYAPAEITCELYEKSGETWIAIHRARHDGIAWQVYETLHRPLGDLVAIIQALAEVIKQNNLVLPDMEELAARLNTPGTTHQLNRMKIDHNGVCRAEELFSALLAATKP